MKKLVLSVITASFVLSLSLFSQQLEIHAGWQLKGTESGLKQEDFDRDCINTVWTYDEQSGWSVYSPDTSVQNSIQNNGNLKFLTTVERNQGFWINANSDCNITGSGAMLSDSNISKGNQDHNATMDQNITLDGNLSTLTQDVIDGLKYMGDEERLAYDVYNKLYSVWGTSTVSVLNNIATKAEIKHIQTVQALIQKYDIEDTELYDTDIADIPAGTYEISSIQALYDALVEKGEKSEQDALEVGCMVEVTDINDLDKYIQDAIDSNASDVVDALSSLRDGSYNHYWSFDQALKNMGVSDGCCSLGVIDGVDYCHNEYPQNQ